METLEDEIFKAKQEREYKILTNAVDVINEANPSESKSLVDFCATESTILYAMFEIACCGNKLKTLKILREYLPEINDEEAKTKGPPDSTLPVNEISRIGLLRCNIGMALIHARTRPEVKKILIEDYGISFGED